jgi:hypothetical protein
VQAEIQREDSSSSVSVGFVGKMAMVEADMREYGILEVMVE